MTPPPNYIAAAWKSGELGYKLREVQKIIRKKWLKSKSVSRKFVINCNRRLGKSTWGLEVMIEGAIKKPGFHGLFCAPVKDSLRAYVAPLVTKLIGDAPVGDRPTLDSNLVLRFPNGSAITFRGSNAQSYQNLRGNDFDLIFVDEFRNLDNGEDLLKSVLLPAIFNSAGFIIIASTPPDTEEHYLNTLNQEAEAGGYYFHCDINDCARWDKEDFSPDQIEEWRKETNSDIIWTREYLAKFIRDVTTTLIPEWSDEWAVKTEQDVYFPFYHKYVAMDLGVKDKTVALFAYYDFLKAKIIIQKEFAVAGDEVRTDRIADRVKSIELDLGYQAIHDKKDPLYKSLQNHERVYRRVADNNNPLLINDLNSLHGLDFFGTRKDELPAMVNLCREFVKDGRILIDPSCVEIIGCLRNGVWDKNKKEFARSKVYGHFDALAALIYLVRNIDTSTNPIPKFFGKNYATHNIPMNANPNHSERAGDALAKLFNVKTDRERARNDFANGRGF